MRAFREAHKLWAQRGNGLRGVLAQPVTFEGVVREKAHHVHVDASFFQRGQGKPHVASFHFLVHCQRELIALPTLAVQLQPHFCVFLAIVAHKGHEYLVFASIGRAKTQGAIKLLQRRGGHSLPSFII